MHKLLNLAVHHNMTYVCTPDDWKSAHRPHRLGDLFGCNNDSDVFGDLIAAKLHLPQGLTTKTAHVLPGGRFAPDPRIAFLDVPVQDNVLYEVVDDCSSDPLIRVPMRDFGESYKWFRSQFHQVRKQNATRRNPKCWLDSAGKKKIAVLVRRGDDASGRGAQDEWYLKALDKVFNCELKDLCIKEHEAHIIIQSQKCPSGCAWDKFPTKFKQAVVTLKLDSFPEPAPAVARNELIDALDCVSVADVLITSGGGFSDLAAALLHDEGRSLNLHRETHTDVPNALHFSDLSKPDSFFSFLQDRH